MADLISGAPLAQPTQHAYIQGQFDALVKILNAHLEFVYTRGSRGRPIHRKCACCRRAVFLNRNDRYCLAVGSYLTDDPRDQTPHELCVRPALAA